MRKFMMVLAAAALTVIVPGFASAMPMAAFPSRDQAVTAAPTVEKIQLYGCGGCSWPYYNPYGYPYQSYSFYVPVPAYSYYNYYQTYGCGSRYNYCVYYAW
jgi:hypothetical protein